MSPPPPTARRLAFTFTELLASIVIVGLIVGTVVYFTASYRSTTEAMVTDQKVAELNKALDLYKISGGMKLSHSLRNVETAEDNAAVINALKNGVSSRGDTVRFLDDGFAIDTTGIVAVNDGARMYFAEGSPGSAPTIDNNIIVWLKMDEGSGTTLADSSGNGYDFTTNCSWTSNGGPGGTGTVPTFNGTSQYGYSNSPIAYGTNVITLATWYYWNTNANDDDILAESSANLNTTPNTYLIIPNASDTTSFNASVASTGSRSEGITRPSAGAWHHLAVVLDNSTVTGDVKIYIDGTLQTSDIDYNAKSGTANFATQTLYLMARATTSLFGAGRLKDFRIYEGELDSTEVTAVMNGEEPIPGGNEPEQILTMIKGAGSQGSAIYTSTGYVAMRVDGGAAWAEAADSYINTQAAGTWEFWSCAGASDTTESGVITDFAPNYDNSVTSVDLTLLTGLETLSLNDASLTSIDLSAQQTTLVELSLQSIENVSVLNLTGFTQLQFVDITYCDGGFSAVTLTGCTDLQEAHLSGTGDSNIDLSGLTALTTLNAGASQFLQSLDVSGCTSLTSLNLDNSTEITTLDVSGCSNLNDVSIQYVDLSATSLNTLYTDLPTLSGTIDVTGATGAASADTCIATAKGWTVTGGGACTDDEFGIAGATYYAVAEAGYSYNATQNTNYGARKYNTLVAAEAAIPASPTTPIVINILGTWGSAETAGVTVDGSTPTSTNYVLIRALGSARHTGKWTSTAWRLQKNDGNGITIADPYVTVQGLQVQMTWTTGSTQYGGFYANAADVMFDSCIAKGVISGASLGTKSGFRLGAFSGLSVRNSIAYDFTGATGSTLAAFSGGATAITHYIYNCTAVGSNIGFRRGAGTFTATNCLAQSCTDGYLSMTAGASGAGYNISDIASDAPGTSSTTGTVQFVNAASDDYHLASGDFVAAGAGTDLSGTFTQDIDGEARSAPWSIGADHIDYSIPTGTIIASDNFNRTNSSTLGANWTNPMGNYPQIISNTASGTGLNADEPAYYNAATFGNNQFSRVTVGSLTSGDAEIQLLLRASGTGASFNAYVATVGANGYITFSRYVNAGWVMDASSAVSFTAGDVAEFRVIGTTLQILKNGSVVASRTDTNYSSGKPGLGFWADLSAATADNWEGGEF